jgi:hypothetical protein
MFIGLGFGTQIPKPQSKTGFQFLLHFSHFGIIVAPVFKGGFGAFGTCFQFCNLCDWLFPKKKDREKDFKNFVSLSL